MRRIFACLPALALILGLLVAAPAQANTSADTEAATAVALAAPALAQAQAMGLEYQGYRSVFNQTTGTHEHAWLYLSPIWYRSSNNRDYRFSLEIGINHYFDLSGISPDAWQPWFDLECRRYIHDSTTNFAYNACNIDVNSFSAIDWANETPSSAYTIEGTANPADKVCTYGTQYTGQYRDRRFDRPWVMSYLGYMLVRFLTDLTNCSSLHLTNEYRGAGKRTNIVGSSPDYEESVNDDYRSGLHAI